METKLNNIQLENIKQILTLRYSTNLENSSLPLQSHDIQNSIIETPEIFVEKSIRNIPNIKVTDINHFSAFDIVKFKKIVFTESSIKELEKRYA